MRDTQLIMVEGLPGLGKTTTASWLAVRLRAEHLPVRLCLVLQPHFRRDVTLSGFDSLFLVSQAISEASRRGKRDASAQTTGLSMTSTVVVFRK